MTATTEAVFDFDAAPLRAQRVRSNRFVRLFPLMLDLLLRIAAGLLMLVGWFVVVSIVADWIRGPDL